MRNMTKRSISLLVVIAMCLSFIVPAVQLPAAAETTVTYKYDGDYIYNWGIRDELATFLSPNAESFYQSNGVIYSDLAAMAGSGTVSEVPSTPLYRELQDIMSSAHTHKTSYNETRDLYQYTDCQQNGEITDKISTFYTGKLVGPGWDGGKTWNREHTWPDSKGLNGSDENDIMMLRPANPSVNSSRGNSAYGEGANFEDPSDRGQNVRGDVARIMLYQYVRWGNTQYMWGASGVMESKEILLKWMEEDPVDTWEMGRNDAVESITGTRNVFVDYPELAFALFNEEVPANYSTPANGTSVEITMVTVQFSENGTVTNLITAAEDKQITLPEPVAYVPAGYTFVGWVESTVADTTTKPSVHTAGSKFPAEDIVLHALYSITEESEGGSTGGSTESGYIKVTDAADITTGQYVMVLDAGYAPTVYESGWVLVAQPTISGDKVTDTKDAVWTLTVSGTSVQLTDANGTSIKPKAGNNNGIQTGAYNWALSFADGKASFKGTGSDTTTLAANKGSSYKIRAYKNSTVTGNTTSYPSTFTLYKLTEAQGGGSTTTVTYTTTIAPCEHENTEDRAKVSAQCEVAGTEAGVFCLDCQTYISGGTEIEALEHIWVAGEVTPPTETQQGYTAYTCSRGCGATKHDDFTDALGVTYTVKFSVPAGVTAIADAQVDGIEGMTLPVPSGTPGTGYSFVGWAEAAVETTTTAPAVLGEFYIPTSNITLYAVYTYVVGGSGRTEYTLVTSTDDLGIGHELVLVGVKDDAAYVMSTNQKNNNRGAIAATITGNAVTWTAVDEETAQLITLEEGTEAGTYAMNVGSGYLYAASSSGNYLRTGEKTADASWVISISEDKATMLAQGSNSRNSLRFNYNNGSPLFAAYAADGNTGVQVSLYSKGIPGTTYYSTLSCTHENAQGIPEIEPECEVNGYEDGVFCPDCQTYLSGGAVIPMLGHNMQAGQVTPPTATEQGYTTYTCANGCGKTEQRDYTDPTGEVFEVSFVVPTGVAAVAPMNINALTGATLPSAGAPAGDYTYVFAGWADAAITEATTTVPVLYTGNYKPTEETTLYAVYTYAVGGGASTGESWKLVTNAANLSAGDEIAIVGLKDGSYYAMSTTQNNNNRGSVAATVDTDTQTLTMTNDIQVITVENGEVAGTIALNVGNGYLYAASSGSNHLKTQTTNNENGSWSVAIDATGIATLIAQGSNTRNWMRFNGANNPPIFSCYATQQNDIYLYEKVADNGSTVYYTSVATGSTEPEQPGDPEVPGVTEGTLLTELPADGSYVIIVNGTNAMAKTASGSKIAATTATVTEGILTTTDDMARLKVVVDGENYVFMLGEKYLTSGATGNGLSYSDTLTDCGRWTFTSAGDGLWYINNVGANFNGNYNQALEYYSGFTTYGIKETAAYQMQLFAANAPQSSEPETPQDPDGTVLTIAEAIAKGEALENGAYTATKYAVTGVVDELVNATYGNLYIADENGNRLYIYGVYDATGTNRYDAMETKPVVGDTVTLLGYIGKYNDAAQMQNGWMIAYTAGEGTDEPEYPEADSTLTITEANALGGSMTSGAYTPDKYYVTGVITEVYNTTYGNMYIKDDQGNTLTVYGTYDATGEIRYDALETKPVAGDQVTVYGVIGNYSGTAQMKNGWITAHTPAVEEPPAEPEAPEFPVSDKIIGSVADLLPGTYKMAAYIWKNSDGTDISAAPFHLWNGTVNYGDLVTSSYAFASDTLSAADTDDAVNVVLVGVPGKDNTFYIMVGEQYLYSTETANRKLALSDEPVEWVAADHEDGGIVLTSNGVSLGSANAKSKFLRSYADASNLVSGVYFFAVNVPEPAAPIALKSMNIQLGSSMSLNLNGLASVLDQYENVYVIYEAEGKDPVKVTRYFESINQNDNTLRYNFAYEGLTILDLNLKVNYTIYGTFNGKEYHSETKSIALLTYCRSSVTSGNGAAVPCANLLKYAMAAEAYMKEKDPSLDESKFLVNVLSATELAAVETHAYADSAFNAQKTSVVHNGTRVKFKSQTLDMVSRITLLYKIQIVDSTVDTSKLTFKVEYKDTKGTTQVKDYTFSDLVYEPATGYYVLKFSEFYATQMREGAKCTIYIDGVEHADYTNSIENYCYTANTSTTESEAVKYLAKRISLYGDACYATYGNQ